MRVLRGIGVASAITIFGATAASAQAGAFSGFHLGAVLGGGWSATTWDAGPGGIGGDAVGLGGFPATGLAAGVVAGVRAGYTFQAGSFAFGVESLVAGANIDGQIDCGTDQPLIYGYICVSELAALATVTARAGIVRGDSFLYGMGGIAWGVQRYDIQEPAYFIASWGTASETARGWTVGAGVERRLSHGFSMRADYSYVRFGAHEVVLESPFVPDSVMTLTQGYHFATIGFDFRFGADDLPPAPATPGGWAVEAGTRTFAGGTQLAWDLFNPYTPAEQLSRIVYRGPLLTGEAFLRAANDGRLFVNAALGTGATTGGTMIDEDFPPFTNPYSATLSRLGNGRVTYANVDIGVTLAEHDRWAAGAYLGVGALLERYAAFGCEQIAGGTSCAVPWPGFIAVLSQTSFWDSSYRRDRAVRADRPALAPRRSDRHPARSPRGRGQSLAPARHQSAADPRPRPRARVPGDAELRGERRVLDRRRRPLRPARGARHRILPKHRGAADDGEPKGRSLLRDVARLRRLTPQR